MQPVSPPLPRPGAVVFDLDGTLVDTVETRIRAWREVFDELEIPSDRASLAPLIGVDGRRLAREVAASAGIEIDAARSEEIDRLAGERYGILNTAPRPLPGARALLVALDRAAVPWAIATSSRREQVGASVAALRLGGEPSVVDGSHVAEAKPAPDLLLHAARELAVEPERCWYVGDSAWDMQAAVAAGMLAIGVVAGAAVDEPALRAAGASAVVSTLDQLAASVEG